jgi:uncharacterized RDD family membrane protein YckC
MQEQQILSQETNNQQTESPFDKFEYATVGQRFLNYLIDLVILYIVAIGMATASIVVANAIKGTQTNVGGLFQELLLILMIVLVVLYYTFIEGASNGRSVGKLVTRTKVVNDDGSEISWKNALVRSLCRIIPFEAFTGFGAYPLHDRISHTKVIKIKK